MFLSDLDGVIRRFDVAHRDRCEDRHGLDRGSLAAAAFEVALIDRVITGQLTHADWIVQIGERVGSADAASEWMAHRGWIDADVMTLIDRLRARGTPVAVLTNGTDRVEQELLDAGVVERVDRVFNSWHMGVAKPDVRAFRHVVDELGVNPDRVFFTDDTASKLAGATALGMTTHHFTGIADLVDALRTAGFSHATLPS